MSTVPHPTAEHHGQRHSHVVGFYDTDGFLADMTADFLRPAVGAGDGVVLIASEEHRALLVNAVVGEQGAGSGQPYARQPIVLDAEWVRQAVVVDGMPDPVRFRAVVGGEIDRAGAGERPVRVFGETVALLCAQGNRPAALALEDLWNDLAVTRDFDLLCGYPLAAFGQAHSTADFLAVCQKHSGVANEGYAGLGGAAGDHEGRPSVVTLHRAGAPVRSQDRRERAHHPAGRRRTPPRRSLGSRAPARPRDHALERLLDAALPTDEILARVPQYDRRDLARARARHRLLGLRVGDEIYHPAWQFSDDGPVDGLPRILDLLIARLGHDVVAIDHHLRTRRAALDDRSLADLLRAGRAEEVIAFLQRSP